MNKIRVKLVKSRIQANGRQAAILDGLNLKKLNAERELEDTPAIRGMVAKVAHLVKVL
ncbi:MAG: 50S ribosomal protein L30 [Deltaproteobacteria bacterium HGW-Deltaproteobacteria-14]|jgi:large subunit ribosomal protein L30|nr:MAG: 50S ribosomal protein L30 [Deltaproteobacteria bacterium HGW-Deltaproteobacteria-14]